jgi:hypothetical protein
MPRARYIWLSVIMLVALLLASPAIVWWATGEWFLGFLLLTIETGMTAAAMAWPHIQTGARRTWTARRLGARWDDW